ncbi:MAG TPA: hypothetical protein VIP11_26655 [Gemmatimonadaceae bacterium]
MIIALRLLHILAGVFWAGAVFFVAVFLLPSIRDSGPSGGAVMRQLVGVRKYPIFVFVFALITVLSGAALYMRNVSLSAGAFARSNAGMTYGIGALAALVTLGIGMAVLTPTAKRLGVVAATVQAGGGPPSAEQAAEMGRLQARMGVATSTVAVLLLVTVLTMAIARYV